MVQIFDRIFTGGIECATPEFRKPYGITAVLNVAEEIPEQKGEWELYRKLGVHDHETIPEQLLLEMVMIIEEWLHAGHTVLVHCAGGVSRSVGVVVAFLFRNGWEIDSSLEYIRRVHHSANPCAEIRESIRRAFPRQ